MAASSRAHGNDAVHALLDCLAGVAQIDDIVKHQPSVVVHRGDDFRRRPQARNDNRHFVPDAGLHIVEQSIIAGVSDLIDCKRRHGIIRMRRRVVVEPVPDLTDPVIQCRLRTSIQRWKCSDDTRRTVCNQEIRYRHDEHRRANQWHAQIAVQCGR